MGNFITNLGRWIVTLVIFGFVLYFVYLFTIYVFLQAPKGVFFVGLVVSTIMIYSTRDSKRENGEKYYKNFKEMFVSFVLTFLFISWLCALALGLLDSGGPSPTSCIDDICDDPRIP